MRAIRIFIALLAVCLPGCVRIADTIVEWVRGDSAAEPSEVPVPRPATARPTAQSEGKMLGPERPASPSPEQEAEDRDTAEKLQRYATPCRGFLSPRIQESHRRYTAWTEKNPGFTVREPTLATVQDMPDPRACLEAIAEAKTMAPDMPELETAARAYGEALQSLAPVLREAHTYYEREDYKDDRMAKGKALHPRLLAGFSAFIACDTELTRRIDAAQQELRARRITWLSLRGPSLLLSAETSLDAAEKLVAFTRVSPYQLRSLDSLALQAMVDRYQQLVDELTGYQHSAKEVPGQFDAFVQRSSDFLVSAKALLRRSKRKVPWNRSDRLLLDDVGTQWMVNGSPGQLADRYNKLVSVW